MKRKDDECPTRLIRKKPLSIRSLSAHTTASKEGRFPKTRRRTAGTAARSPDGMTSSRAANVTRPREVNAGRDEIPGAIAERDWKRGLYDHRATWIGQDPRLASARRQIYS